MRRLTVGPPARSAPVGPSTFVQALRLVKNFRCLREAEAVLADLTRRHRDLVEGTKRLAEFTVDVKQQTQENTELLEKRKVPDKVLTDEDIEELRTDG